MNFDGATEFNWNFYELFESTGSAFWIGDIARKICSTAIEFKIEVAGIRFGLKEKFHATVFPNFIAISGPHAANKLVLDFEDAVNSRGVIKQADESARMMFAGFFAEIF